MCYAPGITAADLARMSRLFERFVSRERDELPDIDVDYEHQRREEVIQPAGHVTKRIGRRAPANAPSSVDCPHATSASADATRYPSRRSGALKYAHHEEYSYHSGNGK